MSKNNSNNTSKCGIGFCELLAIAFIVLKLTGVIKWSWLWVLSPVWILVVLAIVLMIAAVLIGTKRK